MFSAPATILTLPSFSTIFVAVEVTFKSGPMVKYSDDAFLKTHPSGCYMLHDFMWLYLIELQEIMIYLFPFGI